MPSIYGPPTRKVTTEDYSRVVHTIRVTIHNRGVVFDTDTRSTNHASIYLLIDDGKTSVRLNMAQADLTESNGSTWISAGDEMGKYELTHCNYGKSKSSLRDFDLKAAQGLRVEHVLSLINQKGRHKYKLHRTGVGCRYWVQTIIKDLNDSNYIKKSSPVSAAKAIDGLQYNYSAEQEPVFEEVEKGTFI